MFDLICLGVILGAAALGWRKGFLLTVLGLGGLFGGYLCAWLLNKPVGAVLSSALGWQPAVARPVAGILVVLVFVGVMGFVQRGVRRGRIRKQLEGWQAPMWDRAGGAAVQAVWAGLFTLLVAWTLIWLHGLQPRVPDVRESVAGRVASRLVSATVYQLTRGMTGNDAVAGTAAAMARDPKGSTESLAQVLSNEHMQSALGDPATREAVVRGDRRSLAPLAHDDALLESAYGAGLIHEDPAALSPEERERAVADGIGPLVGVVQELVADPTVRDLLADPVLRSKIQRGNMAELAQDPKFNQLAARVMEVVRAKDAPAPAD